eukprot:TRINITY_DN3222_c0_g1_i3.p1 TRINITY_DN3222_c0_g1~~TRINITY_DN3222_c0_g1_i3.p1  ORF type:complete len:533 (+),score=103.42 TRINITY_DN3222_c0_g1_i3:35-1600(+)
MLQTGVLLFVFAIYFLFISPSVHCQNHWPYVGGTPHRNHISLKTSGFPVSNTSVDLEMFGKNLHLFSGEFSQPPTVGTNVTFTVTVSTINGTLVPSLTAFDMNTTQLLWKEDVYSSLEETAVHPTQPFVCFCERNQEYLRIKCRRETGELLWETEIASFKGKKPPQYVVLEFLSENLLVVELSNDGATQRVALQHFGLSFINGTILWKTVLPFFIHNTNYELDDKKKQECRVVFDYTNNANSSLDEVNLYSCTFSPLTISYFKFSLLYSEARVNKIWSWSPQELPQRLHDIVLYNDAQTLLVVSGPRIYGLNANTGNKGWSYVFTLDETVNLFITGSTLTSLDATGQKSYYVYVNNDKTTERLLFTKNSVQLANSIPAGSNGHGAVGRIPAEENNGVVSEYLYLCNSYGFQVLQPTGSPAYAPHSGVNCHDVIIASPNRVVSFSSDDQTIYFFYTGPTPPTSPPPEGWAHADDSTRANLPSWALVLIGVLTIVAIVLVIGFFLYYSYYRYRVYKGEYYESF